MKENIQDTSHDLLVKYLLEEATPEEIVRVERWLKSSEENNSYFIQLKTIWQQSRMLAPAVMIDEEDAWQRFGKKIKQQNKTAATPIYAQKLNWLKAAAILLFLAGGSYLAYWLSVKQGDQLIKSTEGRVMSYTLPDGSVVTLNKNASVAYNGQFNNTSRNITLKGEAFFNVVADNKKPFIIQMDDISVKVVGTSFNIKNAFNLTEVIVETGVVSVSKRQYSVQLRQNEKAIIFKDKNAPEKISVSSRLYKYYRTNQFVCVETPLPELVAVLNEAYNSRIKIGSGHAATLKLTTTLDNKSLEQVLEVIKETLGINIERNNGEIILN